MDDPNPREIARAILPPESSDEEIEETQAVFESTEVEVFFRAHHLARLPRLGQGPEWKFLTLLGDTSALEATKVVGIVGRRDPTDPGLQFTHDLAEALGRKGVPTLSGMARGIDRAAHQGSLSTGASTIAAIPEGILRFLRRNKQHFPELHSGSVSPLLVISGTSPWENWNVGEAMRRNRWIANWCDVLIVVEANPDGGTWRTAEAAANEGKPIWVCTGFDDQVEGLGNAQLGKTFRAKGLDVGMDVEEAVNLVIEG